MDVFQYVRDNCILTPEQGVAFLMDFTDGYRYQEFVEDPKTGELILNPVTRKQFANYWIIRYFKDVVNAYRQQQAQADVTWERLELE